MLVEEFDKGSFSTATFIWNRLTLTSREELDGRETRNVEFATNISLFVSIDLCNDTLFWADIRRCTSGKVLQATYVFFVGKSGTNLLPNRCYHHNNV